MLTTVFNRVTWYVSKNCSTYNHILIIYITIKIIIFPLLRRPNSMFFFFIFTYHHSIRYLAISILGLFTWHCYSIANFVSEASSSIPQRVAGTVPTLHCTFGTTHSASGTAGISEVYLHTRTIIKAMSHKEEQLGMRYFVLFGHTSQRFSSHRGVGYVIWFLPFCVGIVKILTYYLCGQVSVLVGWLLTECIPMNYRPSIFPSDSTTEWASIRVSVSNKWSSVGGGA